MENKMITVIPSKHAITAGFMLIFSGLGVAQTLPADCSAVAAPSQPLTISIAGKKFTPKIVKLRGSNVSKTADAEYQSFGLGFRNEDSIFSPMASSATILVVKGQRVDGKTFRKLPTKETLKQPGPSSGMPEVQGWSFEDRPEKVRWSHVKYVGSLRLEFGQRQGDMISGSIYLCVPKGQTSTFDKKPTSEDSYAIGTFTARIE
jgi:hypothetical protein